MWTFIMFFIGAILSYPKVAGLLHVSHDWYPLYLFVMVVGGTALGVAIDHKRERW